MKRTLLILALVGAAIGACAQSDIEVSGTVAGTTNATLTHQCEAGILDAVVFDFAAGATGEMSLAVSPSPYTGLSRNLGATTNGANADLWVYPTNAIGRRFVLSDKDRFTLTVTNMTATAKEFRAVIRVQPAK